MEKENNNIESIEKFWIRMEPRIRYWISQRIIHRELEESMLSVVKCRVFTYREKIESIEDPDNRAAYLKSIVVNCCNDEKHLLRKEYGYSEIEIAACELDHDLDYYEKDFYNPVEDRINCMMIMGMIEKMPAIYAELLIVMLTTGESSERISAMMNLNIETYRKRRQRAIKLLKKSLSDHRNYG